MKENFLLFVAWVIVVLIIWFMGSKVSDFLSDYEVIKPTDGIECVVVSRMFNTSVDCWRK